MTKPAEPRSSDDLKVPVYKSSSSILSIGIVGAGNIVSRVHLPVLSACSEIKIAYVADKNERLAKSVASGYSLSAASVGSDIETLPQTDVVLLAVPVLARLPYYELFAKRGTSVLAEKPLAARSSDAEYVCGLYSEHSLVCGFQRRSYSAVTLAKKIIREKWFGPLLSMSVSEGALTTKTGVDSHFYDHPTAGGGGVLMDLGCHSLDLAIYITGANEAVPIEQRFVNDGGVDREVAARLSLRTMNGEVPLEYLVTWLRPAKNAIELLFENCSLTLSCQPSGMIEVRGRRGSGKTSFLTEENFGATTTYQAFYLEWSAFLEGIRSRHACEFSAQSCLPTIRAIEALYRSKGLK
jgi:predicted dehydrogenase